MLVYTYNHLQFTSQILYIDWFIFALLLSLFHDSSIFIYVVKFNSCIITIKRSIVQRIIWWLNFPSICFCWSVHLCYSMTCYINWIICFLYEKIRRKTWLEKHTRIPSLLWPAFSSKKNSFSLLIFGFVMNTKDKHHCPFSRQFSFDNAEVVVSVIIIMVMWDPHKPCNVTFSVSFFTQGESWAWWHRCREDQGADGGVRGQRFKAV